MKKRNIGVFGVAFSLTFTSIILLYFVTSILVVQFAVGMMVNSTLAAGTLYLARLVRSNLRLRISEAYVALAMFTLSAAFFSFPILYGDSELFVYFRLVFLALGTLVATFGLMTAPRAKMS